MKRSLAPLPAAFLGSALLTEAAAVALSWGLEAPYDTFLYAVFSTSLVGAGALIASREPGNSIGWLFCGFGLLNALAADLAQGWGLRAVEQGWPAGPAAEWTTTASWLPSGFGWVLTFLLFPTGRLPGRRWVPVVWLGAAGFSIALVGWALSPDRAPEFAAGRNPLATDALPTAALFDLGFALITATLLAAVVSLVLRARRADAVQRQQVKWFTYAAVLAAVVLPASAALWDTVPVVRVLAAVALTALPVAACVAILRYRLYDIDVVINRTLVYAVLTVLLAAAYAATALLLGIAVGRGSAWATAGATLVVAVAFRPLRARVQDATDRRFNRARYTALHRMTDFLEALRAGRAAPEEVQDTLRAVLADQTVELHYFLPESHCYVDAEGAPVTDAAAGGRTRLPIERGGRPLAEVLHDPSPGDDPTLLRQVVEAGGLAIEIARLRVELRRQLAEVRASRTRIIEAGNAERRRLERDLHDGAQQRLVSIGLALRHAQHQLTTAAPEQAGRTLDEAVAEIAVAIEELRGLAHGLPPAQLDAGLVPAFRELSRRAPLPVEVTAPEERFGRDVEAAVYYIGCEGLTNAIKHAGATRVTLSAGRSNGSLVVSVVDDGVGGAVARDGSGLRGLADRVAALGGTLRLESVVGSGTTLTAELPCVS
ncbi:histidine kinase [Modestobacter sp. URMC 112]